VELLDRLHALMQAADAAAAPLLRRLFLAAFRPFAECLESWVFRPGAATPSASAFCEDLPFDLQSLLPARAAPSVRYGHFRTMQVCLLSYNSKHTPHIPGHG
jgi:hypothetical protein